jgi:hypothetical protein
LLPFLATHSPTPNDMAKNKITKDQSKGVSTMY